MVEYMEAIKKPFSDMKTLGIGAVVGAIPLVSLLLSGYALKTAEDAVKGKKGLRAWALSDVADYAVKLVMLWIISIVYYIIPALIIGVGIGGAILTAISGGIDLANPSTILDKIIPSMMVALPFVAIGGIILLIAMFLLPMAIMKWIKSGNVGAAFNIGSVVKNALTVDYIVSLIVLIIYAIVLVIIAGIISLVLAFIPVIGWILAYIVSGAVAFALAVTEYAILAQVVKD